MASGQKAVIAACIANAGIGVAKLVGFILTGSSSLLAEAVHSAADTGNQGLLLFGNWRGKRAATQRHPFGFGRERYFWAFIVALVIFLLGAIFAISPSTLASGRAPILIWAGIPSLSLPTSISSTVASACDVETSRIRPS